MNSTADCLILYSEVIKLKRTILRGVLLCVLMIIPLTFIAAKSSEEEVLPMAYMLLEAETKTVLEEHNSDSELNAGYLGKLMALLVIADDIEKAEYSLDTELTASQFVTGTRGAVVWLQAGDKMTVDELLKGVIIGNANDAMTVLAENSEGSVEAFTMRMNAAAFDLGLRNSAFYSPYGYYDEREHTTAHDIAVICAELSEYDFLTPYFSTWRDFVKDGTVELVNENTLSRTFDSHIGFKASHSEESGYCIAEGVCSDSGTAFIAVVLGADDEDSSFSMVKKLCRKGLSDYKVTVTMFPDEMLMPVKVKKGKDFAVPIAIEQQGTLVIPKNSGELKTVTVLPDYMTAPVAKGQKIGTAAFYNGKNLVYEADIVAAESVDELDYGYVLSKMLYEVTK